MNIAYYCREALCHPLMRMQKDSETLGGRLWQVSWIIALIVAGLSLNAQFNPNIHFNPIDYIKDLFNNTKVFEISCYISLGLFISYIFCWEKKKDPGILLDGTYDLL